MTVLLLFLILVTLLAMAGYLKSVLKALGITFILAYCLLAWAFQHYQKSPEQIQQEQLQQFDPSKVYGIEH